MKRRTPAFVTGMFTTALISGLGVTALAATGQLTITVDPINIQVNGETFQPKDAQGNDVPVFAYNGTTYAPLRALAEAYGLEVGYDAEANMATVGGKDAASPSGTTTPDTTASAADYSDWSAEEEAAYQEFKGMWEIDKHDVFTEPVMGQSRAIYATYNGSLSDNDLKNWMNACGSTTMNQYAERMMREFYSTEDYLRLVFVGSGKPVLWVTSLEVFNGNLTVHTDFDDDAFSSFRN